MFKDLIVPVTNTPGDANAIAAATALAIHANAHLALLEFANLPILPVGPWGSGEIGIGEIYGQIRDEAEHDAAAWRERLSREVISLSFEVRVVESIADGSSNLAALHARCSDLSVMTMATDFVRDMPIIRDFFASLLLDSGRPVLLVPPGFGWRPAKRIVVAWQPRCEATRALHDAMPFLHAAESVDVLEVDEVADEDASRFQPGVDIAAHLARHGLKARVVMQPQQGDSVALQLVRHAQDTGAELIVAGGFGHSRLREWVLGGVTRDLLSGMCPVPILFSH